jgi:ankyrin repeat protein
VEELDGLLASGVPIDTPDQAGDTALMKSIQAGRTAAAALLIRRGADLDIRNHAGESARDMAMRGEVGLRRALGIAGQQP